MKKQYKYIHEELVPKYYIPLVSFLARSFVSVKSFIFIKFPPQWKVVYSKEWQAVERERTFSLLRNQIEVDSRLLEQAHAFSHCSVVLSSLKGGNVCK